MNILEKQIHSQGQLYLIRHKTENIQILLLHHAIDRIDKWQLEEDRVIETLLNPEEVLAGHRGRYIAHRRYGNHVLRAIYEYQGRLPVLVTVYFPYQERYFLGGTIYEDQICK
jgi:hypothetical protein